MDIKKHKFQQFGDDNSTTKNNLDLLMDINVPVTVELAQTNKTIGDIVSLHPGSIIEFNKNIGQAFDILVSGVKIGTGEIIEIDDKFGVRVISLDKQQIKKLGV